MEKLLTDFLAEIRPLISQNTLFLSAFQHVGSNAWVQFYHVFDDSIALMDVVMFDIAEETVQAEIINPTHLHYVSNVDISDTDLHGRKTAAIRFEEATNTKEYKIYFSDLAFHARVRPIHSGERF